MDNTATLSATGDVKIQSEFTDTATSKAWGGVGGLIGALGAQVDIINDNGSQPRLHRRRRLGLERCEDPQG